MSYFDRPPGERVLQEFRVFRDGTGRWIAVEKHGLPVGSFRSRDEALHFALREADGDEARVQSIQPRSRIGTAFRTADRLLTAKLRANPVPIDAAETRVSLGCKCRPICTIRISRATSGHGCCCCCTFGSSVKLRARGRR